MSTGTATTPSTSSQLAVAIDIPRLHPKKRKKIGQNLGPMMQRIHGSAAKLVNDLLPERRVPFWREATGNDYFDGCIRDEIQCRRAYKYTLRQSVRHRLCTDYRKYPHTHVRIDLERGVKRALQLNCVLPKIAYPRYQ